MSNATKLASAAKIFVEIQVLDAQIIEIEKYAMSVANGDAETAIELKYTLNPKEGKSDPILDADGSLIKGGGDFSFYEQMLRKYSMLPYYMTETKSDNQKSLSSNISESETLQILGILLGDKQRKRDELIQKLHKLGFPI